MPFSTTGFIDSIIAKDPTFLNQKDGLGSGLSFEKPDLREVVRLFGWCVTFLLTSNFIYVYILKGIFTFLSWRFILNKLFSWFRAEPIGIELCFFLTLTLIVDLNLAIILAKTSNSFGFVDKNQLAVDVLMKEVPFVTVFVRLPITVFMEEVIFRLPLALFVKFKANLPTILIMSVISSILFGYAHGSWGNVMNQGVGGLVYCVVFLKCGGLQGRYKKAFFSAFGAHLLFDLSGLAYNFVFS